MQKLSVADLDYVTLDFLSNLVLTIAKLSCHAESTSRHARMALFRKRAAWSNFVTLDCGGPRRGAQIVTLKADE
jgi:hypothetical protein